MIELPVGKKTQHFELTHNNNSVVGAAYRGTMAF